jgi:hypothetical protein
MKTFDERNKIEYFRRKKKVFFCRFLQVMKGLRFFNLQNRKIFTVANNRQAICYYVDQFRRISFGNKHNIKEASKRLSSKDNKQQLSLSIVVGQQRL